MNQHRITPETYPAIALGSYPASAQPRTEASATPRSPSGARSAAGRPQRRLMPAIVAALALVFAATSLQAQLMPPAPTTTAKSREADTIILNPFEVKADADTSYGALNSNSITRFNTKLEEVPVSADIFTESFMRDVATSAVEAPRAGSGTAGGGSASAPGSVAASSQAARPTA